MGARAQVFVKEAKVYLYTHWGAEEIEECVFRAIAKGWRWDDEEYLSRIIFDEMQNGDQGNETGFGIGTQQHGDIEKLVTVSCDKQTVTVKDTYSGKVLLKKTFQEIKERN